MRFPALALPLSCAAIVVGCGGSAAPESNESPATKQTSAEPVSQSACKGKELAFIGLAGEEGDKELKAWRDEVGLELKITNNADWGQIIGALKTGQPYDLATIPYREAQRMIAANIFQPIPTERLTNWKNLYPAFGESPLLRGEDGKVYGVPIAWGDSPYAYVPSRVPDPPTSILDLTKPEWKDRFVMMDDPAFSFYLIAKAKGFDKAPLLTPEELDQVKQEAAGVVANAAAFSNSYQDETDRLVAGDVDLAVDGWEAMINFAKEKGGTVDVGFFEEKRAGGWWDGLAIPRGVEDPECALAYIDAVLSAEAQAKLATTLVSGVVNREAVSALPKSMEGLYDYGPMDSPDTAEQFSATSPPESAPEGYTSNQDWEDAWKEVKAKK